MVEVGRQGEVRYMGGVINVGVHFFTLIRKYGNTDPYSVFYHSSIRIVCFIKVN